MLCNKSNQDSVKIFRPWDNDTSSSNNSLSTTVHDLNANHKLVLEQNSTHFWSSVSNDSSFLYDPIYGSHLLNEEYYRILSKEQDNRFLINNSRKQRPKKHKCPHCNVGFSNNGQLKGHIRIHTGERPFRCDEKNCGKTFTRNEELTRHKRIHSGLRPFPCTTCGKRFGRKDHLKKHSRTHLQLRTDIFNVPFMYTHLGHDPIASLNYPIPYSMYSY